MEAEWLQSEECEYEYLCSNCDYGIVLGALAIYKYCPSCGSKMNYKYEDE